MSVMLAFSLDNAAAVTGVSERRLRYWDETGVLSPSLATGRRKTPYGRVYSFRDLVGLRTLALLRDRFDIPLQRLRVIGDQLKRHSETPWSSLRFYVEGRNLYFVHPGSATIVATAPEGQTPMPFVLELVEVARETELAAEPLRRRTGDDFGRIAQNRYVLGNRPVIAGTRIPTKAVWDFHQAGYENRQIIQMYPRLTDLDVENAIAFERDRMAERAVQLAG